MRNGKFRDKYAYLENHLTYFGEIWNLELRQRLPPCKFDFDPTTWVVWANSQFAIVRFRSLTIHDSFLTRRQTQL